MHQYGPWSGSPVVTPTPMLLYQGEQGDTCVRMSWPGFGTGFAKVAVFCSRHMGIQETPHVVVHGLIAKHHVYCAFGCRSRVPIFHSHLRLMANYECLAELLFEVRLGSCHDCGTSYSMVVAVVWHSPNDISGDNKIVIHWGNGVWRPRGRAMQCKVWLLHGHCADLIAAECAASTPWRVLARHVYREQNVEADHMAQPPFRALF